MSLDQRDQERFLSTASVSWSVVAWPPMSGVRTSRSAATVAFSTARAICGRRNACSSIIATVRIAPVGLAMPLPAMSGAAPWIGS